MTHTLADNPTRNSKLLRQIADEIRKEPMHYHQSSYGSLADEHTLHTCGTSHCIGGWAVFLKGFKPAGFKNRPRVDLWFKVAHPDDPGAIRDTESTAGELLGLTQDEYRVLFAAQWLPLGIRKKEWDNRELLAEKTATALELLADGAHIDDVTEERARS